MQRNTRASCFLWTQNNYPYFYFIFSNIYWRWLCTEYNGVWCWCPTYLFYEEFRNLYIIYTIEENAMWLDDNLNYMHAINVPLFILYTIYKELARVYALRAYECLCDCENDIVWSDLTLLLMTFAKKKERKLMANRSAQFVLRTERDTYFKASSASSCIVSNENMPMK